jgi:hypothetical protein
MLMDEHETLRSSLQKIIGRDYVYIEAMDDQRHSDPITAAIIYAGGLFLVFVAAAVKKMGETAGKEIIEKVSSQLGNADPAVKPDKPVQLEQIKAADQALTQLGTTLAGDYFKNFIEAGRRDVEKQLLKNNFPPAKAKRISTEFAELISDRIKSGQIT